MHVFVATSGTDVQLWKTHHLRIFAKSRKSIPKNLSSQAFCELWVNFLVLILTKTLVFVMKRPNLFTKFLGRLRMNFAIGRLFRSPRFAKSPKQCHFRRQSLE